MGFDTEGLLKTITPLENVVFADVQWLNFSPCCSDGGGGLCDITIGYGYRCNRPRPTRPITDAALGPEVK